MASGKCDSCPNTVEGAQYGHDFDEHNQFFYELHVFNSHPFEEAKKIIEDHYRTFPNTRWPRIIVLWPGRDL